LSPQKFLTSPCSRYIIAGTLIFLASLLRIWPLHILGSTLAWLTYYPAVVVASIFGGLLAGLFSAVLACITVVFLWPILVHQPFITTPSDLLGMLFFFLTCSIISVISEGLHRTKERELNYRILYESMDSGYCVVDMIYNETGKPVDYRFVEVNPAFENHTGFANSIGKTIRALVPNHEEHWLEIYEKVARTGESARFENPAVAMQKYFDVFAYRIGDAGSNRVGILFTDISERKLAEKILRKSEERYHSLFDNMIDGFAYCKMLFDGSTPQDFIYISVNTSFYRQTGLKDVIGKKLSEVLPGSLESNPELIKTYGRVSVSGGAERFETYVIEINTWFLISIYSPEKDYFVAVFENITERKLAEETIRQSEYSFRTILENSPIAVRIASKETGRVIFANKNYCDLIDASYELAIGGDPRRFYVNQNDYEEIVAQLEKSESVINKLVKLDNGSCMKWVLASFMVAEFDRDPAYLGWFFDVSSIKQAENELRISAAAFETQDAIMITDADAFIIKVNRSFTSITGFSPDEVIGRNPRIMKSGRHDRSFYVEMFHCLKRDGTWQGEIWDKRKNGEIYPRWMTITAIKDEQQEVIQYVSVFSDITERKKNEELIYKLALCDPLTQLPNRRMLTDRLKQAMASNKRRGIYGAVMFIDLDKFKPLNDTHGHVIGDLLLIEVGRRISGCIRETDTVARFGGDEFVVKLGELHENEAISINEALRVAEKIRSSLAEIYCLKFQAEDGAERCVEHSCSSSIGVALFNGQEESQEAIFRQADAAMYQAKEGGRNQVFYKDKVSGHLV